MSDYNLMKKLSTITLSANYASELGKQLMNGSVAEDKKRFFASELQAALGDLSAAVTMLEDRFGVDSNDLDVCIKDDSV